MEDEDNNKYKYCDLIKATSRDIRIYIHACKNKKKHDKIIKRRYEKFIAQKNKDFNEDIFSVIKSFMITEFYVNSRFLPKPFTKILISADWEMEHLTVMIGKRYGHNFIQAKKVFEYNTPIEGPFKIHKINRIIVEHPTKPNTFCMEENIDVKWCFIDFEMEERDYYRNSWLHWVVGYDEQCITKEHFESIQDKIDYYKIRPPRCIAMSDMIWFKMMSGAKYRQPS